jgi:phytoene synthase
MEASADITRRSASNLALAFILLPKPKRDGMAALYALCRQVDDVADDESVPIERRRAELASWRAELRVACDGSATPQRPVLRELQPVIAQCRLPFALFDELLCGVEADLDVRRYADYAQLEAYCYRVASVVGLLSIEIFGYRNPQCRDYAVHLGKALQLTNILRDVGNDAERGRIYLPLDELRRHQVSEDEILQRRYSPRFAALASSVAERARGFYRQAHHTLPAEDLRSMAAAELMGTVYWRLLQKLAARQFDVFSPKLTRVSKAQKIFLILRTWYRVAWGGMVANYGVP